MKYGGLKFLEAAHVKDVIAVFRWTENPNDRVAGFQVLKLLPGIGPTTAAKVQDHVAAKPFSTGRGTLAGRTSSEVARSTFRTFWLILNTRMRKVKELPGIVPC